MNEIINVTKHTLRIKKCTKCKHSIIHHSMINNVSVIEKNQIINPYILSLKKYRGTCIQTFFFFLSIQIHRHTHREKKITYHSENILNY